MTVLLEPKELELAGKTFVLSKFPAIQGRKIITQYPVTGLPEKAGGNYSTNEDLMVEVMSRVGVKLDDGEVLVLSSRTLIDNHVPGFEVLMKLEWAMMEYNCSFFRNGSLSSLVERLIAKLPGLISQTLTASQQQSSAKASPRSTS